MMMGEGKGHAELAEEGRGPPEGICTLMLGMGAPSGPQPPTPGDFSPPIPSRDGSQGRAWPPAQALHREQQSWVPPSSLPPVADGSDITPYHPYFIFSRVFLVRPTLAEEALGREQAQPWAAWLEKLNTSPNRIVWLYLLISTYYAAVSGSTASTVAELGQGERY